MKKLLIKLSSSLALAAVMSVGLAHAANISDTGPHSNNQIFSSQHNSLNQTNINNVSVSNNNQQTAKTGDAIVKDNTWGGSATSGNASNSNQTSTNVDISNSNGGFSFGNGLGSASIDETGPHSNNQIFLEGSNRINETNINNVRIDNQNHQFASSGDAIVADNTHGGNAVSGDATNDNRTSTDVTIHNANGGFGQDHFGNFDRNGFKSNFKGEDNSDFGNCCNNDHRDLDRHEFKDRGELKDHDFFKTPECNSCHRFDFDREHHKNPCEFTREEPCVHVTPPCVRPCDLFGHERIRPPCEVNPCHVVVPCHSVDLGNCHRHHHHHQVCHRSCDFNRCFHFNRCDN